MAPSIHQNFAFEQFPSPGRQAKPRSAGLTMMIDWGMPLGLQEDCLGVYQPLLGQTDEYEHDLALLPGAL
jgi:hypothetical protein